MGFLDAIILIPTLLILLVTTLLLFFSIRSAEDEKAKERYRRTYIPHIFISVLVLILYFGVISIGNTVLEIIQ